VDNSVIICNYSFRGKEEPRGNTLCSVKINTVVYCVAVRNIF